MKRTGIQSLGMVIGSLLAIAIVVFQLFHFQVNTAAKQEVKTEQQKKERPADETCISLPSISLPTSVNVQLNLDSYCLFEISFEEEEHNSQSTEKPLHPEKLIHTLFRVIIAPNAP